MLGCGEARASLPTGVAFNILSNTQVPSDQPVVDQPGTAGDGREDIAATSVSTELEATSVLDSPVRRIASRDAPAVAACTVHTLAPRWPSRAHLPAPANSCPSAPSPLTSTVPKLQLYMLR